MDGRERLGSHLCQLPLESVEGLFLPPVPCAVFLYCWLLTFFTWCCMRIVISLSIKVM